MSAPPENRSGQRFVSSINIPINTDGANEPQAQQPQQQTKPNERVIPIHVEGRDEPVLPKHVNQTFSQTPPQNERVFGQKPAGFGSWKRNESPYYTGESYSSDPHYEGRHQFFSGHPQQRGNAEHFPNTTQQKQQQQQQHTHKPQTPPPAQQKSATPPPQPPPPPSGPISQIQCIQRDVLELMGQVERFNGQPKDKEYVYLDEMLTRNLLKLDNIDTEGKENIRHARKEAINCIQKCISILEAKALANEQLRNAMEVDTKAPEEAPLTALEVSGISRSGSETAPSQQSEVEAPMEESADAAVTENKETDVEPPATNVEMEVQEETPKGESEVVEDKPSEESVESSQEAPKATKKKVKKKEKSAE